MFPSDRWTDKQTNRQTDKQAGRQADRQTDRQAGRQAGRHTPHTQTHSDTHTHTHTHTHSHTQRVVNTKTKAAHLIWELPNSSTNKWVRSCNPISYRAWGQNTRYSGSKIWQSQNKQTSNKKRDKQHSRKRVPCCGVCVRTQDSKPPAAFVQGPEGASDAQPLPYGSPRHRNGRLFPCGTHEAAQNQHVIRRASTHLSAGLRWNG